MKRRSLFVGAAAIAASPIASAIAAVPVPISDAGAEEAFALGFERAPALTWEWGKGFSLAGRPVTDAEAMQWDTQIAIQVRSFGMERHWQVVRRELRAEFHREYGPNKTDSLPLPSFDLPEDAPELVAWEKAHDADMAAWSEFRVRKQMVIA